MPLGTLPLPLPLSACYLATIGAQSGCSYGEKYNLMVSYLSSATRVTMFSIDEHFRADIGLLHRIKTPEDLILRCSSTGNTAHLLLRTRVLRSSQLKLHFVLTKTLVCWSLLESGGLGLTSFLFDSCVLNLISVWKFVHSRYVTG